ncbi:MAG: NAD(P)-binding protein [Proteobacteria bacterium]|nr:NAD(P)-binding protein [Pseudomonadota bacterium]
MPLLPGVLRAAANPAHPAARAADYYPPAMTGLRGDHPGSFEVAHGIRDGARVEAGRDTGERYDLVVVGAGISGLAAAHFYLAARPHARILVLDNHDDFGGHATRNEFEVDGRLLLMNGGTLSIESPTPYSAVADGVLREIGIDRRRWEKGLNDPEAYTALGLGDGVFLDHETFGADHLIVRREGVPLSRALAGAPLSAAVKRDLARIEEGREDFLPGLASDAKKDRLSRISYRQYLLEVVRADPKVCDYYAKLPHGLWGVGIDAVSALDCWGVGLPGFQGLGLAPGSTPRMGFTPAGVADHGWTPTVHFPDGNASIARALVRRLVPAAIAGTGIEDLVTARADYARLDQRGAPVRIRLSSTATRVAHLDPAKPARGVEISYVRAGGAERVQGRHCVLACWNRVIPFICPELPETQRAALSAPSKVPLLYISVALRNWQAFVKLGVSHLYAPGGYYSDMRLNEAVRIGRYATSRRPEEPMVVHATRTPCAPGLAEHEQNRIGRADILATSFETFERNMREQMARMLGPGGFDPARDIAAITVNRWPHGYAHEFNSLFDPLLPPAQRPNVIGRTTRGSIAIANADAAAAAYTDQAIDQAYRAVGELES